MDTEYITTQIKKQPHIGRNCIGCCESRERLYFSWKFRGGFFKEVTFNWKLKPVITSLEMGKFGSILGRAQQKSHGERLSMFRNLKEALDGWCTVCEDRAMRGARPYKE